MNFLQRGIITLTLCGLCHGQTEQIRNLQIGSSEIALEQNSSGPSNGKIKVVLPQSDYLLGVVVRAGQTEKGVPNLVEG